MGNRKKPGEGHKDLTNHMSLVCGNRGKKSSNKVGQTLRISVLNLLIGSGVKRGKGGSSQLLLKQEKYVRTLSDVTEVLKVPGTLP